MRGALFAFEDVNLLIAKRYNTGALINLIFEALQVETKASRSAYLATWVSLSDLDHHRTAGF